MTKRYRVKPWKPGVLEVYYGKESRYEAPDIIYQHGEGCASADGHLLYSVFGCERTDPYDHSTDPSLIDELVARGYDLTTLKFSISKKSHHE